MRRIAKTVEIADADGFDPLVAKLANQAADEIFVERREHAAIGGHPLRHIEAQVARHQRFRQIEIQIIKFVAMLAADLHGVAKPAVVSSAVGAPLRSISALVTKVVP